VDGAVVEAGTGGLAGTALRVEPVPHHLNRQGTVIGSQHLRAKAMPQPHRSLLLDREWVHYPPDDEAARRRGQGRNENIEESGMIPNRGASLSSAKMGGITPSAPGNIKHRKRSDS
jgi:hypothetical protein